MKYELAKELKDAGFPHGLNCDLSGHDHTITSWFSPECRYQTPTLEELIEACAKVDNDFHLEYIYNEWAASTCYTPGVGRGEGKWHDDSWHKGATATEAVARLWLTLNKK